jgi:LacI family fructose operon transcriptional repressor
MASIKDVASHAGVSTTTVSRVLSGAAAVRPAVRDAVQRAIAELGYRPNLAARRLRQQRASIVGLIVSDIRNPFFTEIGRAVEDMAYRHGLRLILCNSDEDSAKEQAYLDLMADEQACGVILSATPERLRRPSAPAPYPLVLIDRAPERLDPAARVDIVQLDNPGAARRLTQHLLDQGHRRIVALVGARSSTGQQRRAAYEALMQAQGLVPQVLPLPPTAQAARAAVLDLLDCADPPEALLASNGLLLLGAAQALQQRGRRIPDDVALAGFDNNDWTGLLPPGITVIAQPTQEMGRSAVELLLQRIAEPARAPRRVVLDGQLLVRGSCARRLQDAGRG